jgi:hypothetical protein
MVAASAFAAQKILQRFLAASGPQMGSIGAILRRVAMLSSKKRKWCLIGSV